ncbi:MAG: fibronectin type III domain-containing protein [Dehalococcoidia bacterium]|nr:fibronectin type III domain-containing protein [Dehalococcoidia bacterium]
MYQSTVPCPKCGAQNLRGQWVCAHCGNTLVVYCPSCHAGNAIDSQYCHACHTALQHTGVPPVQPQYQQPQQYTQYPQYPQQEQYPQPPPGYPPQQPPYQDYQAGYGQYGDYKPYPVHGGEAYAGGGLDGLIGKLKEIVRTTNPVLLSSLVVLVVGMTIFLILAFQFGWIKTGTETKVETVKDTRAPVISMLRVSEGANRAAIISWVTDEASSTQVEYGIWPYANTTTQIESDPRTGVNAGTLTHSVSLTNLLPKTSYIYRAISYDKAGNKGVSPDMQFDTAVSQ